MAAGGWQSFFPLPGLLRQVARIPGLWRVRLSSLAPLALRVGIGLGFATHGWGKLVALYHGKVPLEPVVGAGFIGKVLSAMMGGTEFFGGVCLVLGLLTRFWSAGMVIGMIVAVSTAHRSDLGAFLGNVGRAVHKLFTSPGGFSDQMLAVKLATAEMAWLYLFAALALLLMGPGAFSLDYLVGLIFRRREANAVVGCGMRFPARTPPVEPEQLPRPVEFTDRV